MNDFDPERFEAELQTLRPAKPPPETLARVLAELPSNAPPKLSSPTTERPCCDWGLLVRWLIPAAAVVILLSGWLFGGSSGRREEADSHRAQMLLVPPPHLGGHAAPLLKADKVEIDRQLVADFDAVGKLPSGEPVRFRCQQWMEKVWLRDTAKGVVIEQTTPHLEIVPIRFETD